MAIELNPQGLRRYLDLVDNPIYYYYALQFTKGEFFRAWLGYETIWDLDVEKSLMKQLDHLLNYHAERREYYLEEIEFRYDCALQGVEWKRGVPRRLGFIQHRYHVKAGISALARVNLLDKPNHVDIETSDGRIFTINYIRYLEYKSKRYIRSKEHARPQSESKQSSNNEKDGKRGEAEKTEGSCRKISSKKYHDELHRLRERRRRTHSLSKARTQT